MDQVTMEGFDRQEEEPRDYYDVPVNDEALRRGGYTRNGIGRYERYLPDGCGFFVPVEFCPKCRRPVTGYRALILSNGTLQIRTVPECGYSVAQTDKAKSWAAENIRLKQTGKEMVNDELLHGDDPAHSDRSGALCEGGEW